MDQVDQVLSRGDCKLLSHQVALAFVCSRGKRLGLFLECSGVRLCVLFKGISLDSPGEGPISVHGVGEHCLSREPVVRLYKY